MRNYILKIWQKDCKLFLPVASSLSVQGPIISEKWAEHLQ